MEGPRLQSLITHGFHSDLIPQFRAANPAIRPLLYKDAIFTDSGNGTAGDSPTNPGAVNYASAPSAWFLYDSGGSKISGPGAYRLMDIGSAGYQNAWAQNAIAQAQRDGWDGVFADDLSFKLFTGAKPVGYTDTWWQDKVRSFHLNVGAQIRAAGLRYYVNSTSGGPFPAVRSEFLAYEDGAMEEGWMRPNVSHSGPLANSDDLTWTRQFDALVDAVSKGVVFQAEVPSDTGRADFNQILSYGLASLMLGADKGLATIDVAGSPTYTTPQWFPLYDTAIGLESPLGPYTVSGGVYERNFVGGQIFVNPTTSAKTISPDGVPQTLAATSGLIDPD